MIINLYLYIGKSEGFHGQQKKLRQSTFRLQLQQSIIKIRVRPSTFSVQTSTLAFNIRASDFRLQPSTFYIQRLAFNIQHSDIGLQYSTFNIQTLAFSLQHSAFDLQHLIFDIQTSAFSLQHSTFRHWLSISNLFFEFVFKHPSTHSYLHSFHSQSSGSSIIPNHAGLHAIHTGLSYRLLSFQIKT